MQGKEGDMADMQTNRQEKNGAADGREDGGVRLRTMSLAFMVLAFVVAAVLLLFDSRVNRGYGSIQQASERYVKAQEAATDLQSASDYLTDRVRSFAVTGRIEYMQDYFIEANETRRRDNALASLEDLLAGEGGDAYGNLAIALDYSNELMEVEYHAMRLAVEGHRGEEAFQDTEIPAEVAAYPLTEEEEGLAPRDMRSRARDLLFDEVYMEYKERIRENVRLCTEELIITESRGLDQVSARMGRLLRIQTGLTIALLVIVLCLVLFIANQVRRPLTRMVELMRNQEPVPPTGAAELRYVTRTYNEILLKNKKQQEQLTYDAMHDALTGLYNRSAYEMFMRDIDTEHCALLIIDVDKFKDVNDTYGHDIGDRVLKRVADILRSSFRSVDVICRIGGDEFVVIVSRVTSSMRESIVGKITHANLLLQNPADGLPRTSLSVGIAFSDREKPQGDLFKDADTALYQVKEAGRRGCAIYGEPAAAHALSEPG